MQEALPSRLIGLEACATSHYWARELTKLGHEVRLMPAKDVKAYVKRNKNDAADAEAICEAVRSSKLSGNSIACRRSSPSMKRFIPIPR
jgi:transposase